nr:nucleoside diphosphate kinase 6 isoform X1 [Equus asinus]XP_044611379.1 nucleoside diphosphate kinase 6 isoform X1 [Equus asinus]XP_044611381.1 nucleoside diphosphate kinase 6 isoform X1 [Equus asinus]
MTSILRSPQALQLTLALIKPDAVAHPVILEAVHQQILSNKFLIVRMRELLWRKEDCQKFYQEHEGRFFYQRLVEFMASGPIRAYILARKDAIQFWRTLMGPTRVFRARHVAPDSIRGSFGLTDTRNTTHGSDSVVSASREIAAFFPDFSEQRWYEEEEPQLRCGLVCYSPEVSPTWSFILSFFIAQLFQGSKTAVPIHKLIKLLLVSYLLISHWPKQVTWPSPESMWEGTA